MRLARTVSVSLTAVSVCISSPDTASKVTERTTSENQPILNIAHRSATNSTYRNKVSLLTLSSNPNTLLYLIDQTWCRESNAKKCSVYQHVLWGRELEDADLKSPYLK